MSMDLIKQQDGLELAATLTERQIMIGGRLLRFNELRAFKLDETEMARWAQTLDKAIPDLNLEKLSFAILKIAMGEIEYDTQRGIQNIFRALERVAEPEPGKFKVLRYT